MTRPVEIFGLGACLLHGPFVAAIQRGAVTNSFARIPGGGGLPSVYSIDEALQLVQFLKGESNIPREIRRFCTIAPDLDPSRVPGFGFATADLAILEINSPVQVLYRNLSLVRTEIIKYIFGPQDALAPEIQRAVNVWYYQGLLNGEETLRKPAAEVLAAAVSDSVEDAELARSILRETRGHKHDQEDLVEGIAALRDILGMPLTMMTYTHQYLPDGRPMPWPPDFLEQQIEAANRLGIPYFEPSRIVRHYGVGTAMCEDRVHYREEFQPIMGEVLAQFAAEMAHRLARV